MPVTLAMSGRRVANLANLRSTVVRRSIVRAAQLLAACMTIAACGGGGTEPGGDPPKVPAGFTASLSSSAVFVTAGSSTTITATIARTGSAGTVSLSAESLPAGVTVAFDPADIATSTTSASVTVNAAATATPGAYVAVVRARSSGLSDQTFPVTITVVARPTPTLTLAVTPAQATVQAGSSTAAANVQLTRTAFTEAVAMSVTGLPTGATATFGSASVTTDATTLTISTSVTTTPGIYMLVVQGQSSLGPRVAAFELTVTAPPDFAITAPAALVVRQGLTAPTATVTVARSGGFTGAVALTFEGLPSGITAIPTSLNIISDSATFVLSAANNATVGLATITLRGKATGLPDRTRTLALSVTADPGSFTIGATATATAAQGQSANATITIARVAPFTGAVALTASGLPTGVTASFAPASIAAGATTSTLTLAVGSATVTGVYTISVRGSGPGVTDASANVVLTVTAAPSPLVTQHLLAQEGLAIALASTVLQSQLRVLFAVTSTGQDSAQPCEVLPGGGAFQSLPVGADNPTKAGIYYDAACTKPYILASVSAMTTVGERVTLTETATYYGPTGTLLGTMSLQETGDLGSTPIYVAGLGTFTPANGAQSVRLGLTCEFVEGATTTAPCYGGIEQYVPSLARTIGSVTPLTLKLGATENDPITFSGTTSVMRTGAQGSLTLSLATPTSLAISGGTIWGATTQQGSAANFSLFPPTPTGWTVTDSDHDMRFTINVASNTVRNSVGQITQISTGAVLATIAVDQSGTGTITWSDGRTVAVTSWMFAD